MTYYIENRQNLLYTTNNGSGMLDWQKKLIFPHLLCAWYTHNYYFSVLHYIESLYESCSHWIINLVEPIGMMFCAQCCSFCKGILNILKNTLEIHYKQILKCALLTFMPRCWWKQYKVSFYVWLIVLQVLEEFSWKDLNGSFVVKNLIIPSLVLV